MQTKAKLIIFKLLGAVAPTWAALLPPNVEVPKGAYIWCDKQIVDWVNGPMPALT